MAAPAAGAKAPAAPAVPATYGYLSQPTEQLGIPGVVAGGQITPEGAVHTASAEVVPLLEPGVLGTRAPRTMPDPTLPRYVARPAGDARVTWWAGEVADVPSAIMEIEPGDRGLAGIGLRWTGPEPGPLGARYRFPGPAEPARPGLFWQPGEAFRAGACWTLRREAQGRALTVRRDGALIAVLRGRLGEAVSPRLRTESCADGPGELALAALHRVDGDVEVVVPFEPLPAGDRRQDDVVARAADRAGHDARWRLVRDRAVRVTVPEKRVQDAVRASLVHILVPRYRLADGTWVQTVNKLQYHAFWLRDTAVIARALDHFGLEREAGEDLDFYTSWQDPTGLFVSRPGQMDGHGQALWSLGEHAALTGDRAFARRWAPRVVAAVDWLRDAMTRDPLGIVPPSDPRDNELIAGHLTGDTAWAVGGLTRAADLLTLAGDGGAVAATLALRDRLQARFAALAAEAAGRNAGRLPPAFDTAGGQDWGNLWAAWPEPVLDPLSPIVTETLRSARLRFREGIGSYLNGRVLHGYTGFRVWQTELRRGEQNRAIAGLYSTLAHMTAAHGGFEAGVRPYSTRRQGENLAPHGWLAAELLTFVRDLLVHESEDGLTFMGALPPSWLRSGARTAIENAPTRFGPATVRLTARRGGARLSWRVDRRAGLPEPELRFPLPPGVREATVDQGPATLDGREVRLRGMSGSVNLEWLAPRIDRSFSRTVAALRAGYRRRGVRAP